MPLIFVELDSKATAVTKSFLRLRRPQRTRREEDSLRGELGNTFVIKNEDQEWLRASFVGTIGYCVCSALSLKRSLLLGLDVVPWRNWWKEGSSF